MRVGVRMGQDRSSAQRCHLALPSAPHITTKHKTRIDSSTLMLRTRRLRTSRQGEFTKALSQQLLDIPYSNFSTPNKAYSHTEIFGCNTTVFAVQICWSSTLQEASVTAETCQYLNGWYCEVLSCKVTRRVNMHHSSWVFRGLH